MAARWRPGTGDRLAAVAALLAVAGAGVLTALGIASHLGSILLALAGLICCATASWYAVSRRGVLRLIAVIAALIGLAALLTGLVLAAIVFWEVALLIVLTVGSVAAARHALRHRDPRARWSAPARRKAPATEHPVLIMNLKSGGGKAEQFHLADECRERGIEPVVLRPGDDLRELAEAAVARGAGAIGMAGGDGSQAVVAEVAARHGIPHVCVPAGTRNHFALDLGLDRRDVVGALEAFRRGTEYRIDLARVNGRVFVNNASLGLYAKVVKTPEYRDAKLRTAATVLPDLLGPEAVPLDLRFTGPDEQDHQTAQLILISNNPYQLVHADGRGTRARIDGHTLGIVAIQLAGAADVQRLVALEMAGQVRRYQGWLEWHAPRFEVGSALPVEVGADGETVLLEPPLEFEIWPGALRVLVPRPPRPASAPARARRLLSRSAVADLLRMGAGAGRDPEEQDAA